MQKSTSFKIKGINRDLSPSTFNNDYAYDAKNIRITTLDSNTLLSITNEKGNKVINTIGSEITGTPIGSIVIDDSLILFSHLSPEKNTIEDIELEETSVDSIEMDEETITSILSNEDFIYKITKNGEIWNSKLLYSGYLNFSLDNPIEALGYHDNYNNRKVYWVDGINQPRVINIDTLEENVNWNSESFDFSIPLNLNEEVKITKHYNTNGAFPAGVIQYYCTYISKNGQESSIFYSSPLYYINNKYRAGKPDEYINCSFSIEFSNLSKDAEYVRIYSSLRTSLNDTLVTKKLVDYKISGNSTIVDSVKFLDLGNTGELINSSDLFFKGGDTIIASSINSKDSTLFLGDIVEVNSKLDPSLKTLLQNTLSDAITNYYKTISIANSEEGFYPEKDLYESSNNAKVFKGGEWYRFGIQLQDKYGKWSEPIYINDLKNPVYPKSDKLKDTYIKVWLPLLTLSQEVKKSLLVAGYKKVRPVVVYPTEQERSIICQGVLNPTVFNVGDRKNNTPFAVASWFFRPNVAFDIDTYKIKNTENKYETWNHSIIEGDTPLTKLDEDVYINSEGAIVTSEITYDDSPFTTDSPYTDIYNFLKPIHSKGSYPEFRHMMPIPGRNDTNSKQVEIQSAASLGENTFDDAENSVFGIDCSIFTLNSPEISEDFNKLLDGYSVRVIGIIPITTSSNDILVNSGRFHLRDTTAYSYYPNVEGYVEGKLKYGLKSQNSFPTKHKFDLHAFKGVINTPIYYDGWYNARDMDDSELRKVRDTYSGFLYNVYPWQSKGTLNNAFVGENLPGELEKKILANTKVSFNSYYFENSIGNYSGSDIQYVNSDFTILKDGSMYYGNYDKVVTAEEEYSISGVSVNSYKTESKVYTYLEPLQEENEIYFPVTNISEVFRNHYIDFVQEDKSNIQYTKSSPTEIKFKSTPHIIINTPIINGVDNNKEILPTLSTLYNGYPIGNSRSNIEYFNNSKDIITSQQVMYNKDFTSWTDLETTSIGYGYLWLGELYREVEESILFGGKTSSAIENNLWVPCGEAINIDSYDTTIAWEEGDTYYQRYDCLKTYPTTENDINNIVEVLSFMCESRINLEGRYDKNKGNASNLHTRPSNFNLINPVYSQEDNLFSYRIINEDRKLTTNVPNGIIWSLPKVTGDLADTWTNISTTNLIELDPKLGKVTSIKSYRDDLIAVQPKGLSRVLYNNRVQIPVSEGVPIQISNSGKVEGVQYISKFTGSSNKWSIIETEAGIYFVDDLNKDIFLLSDSLKNLSDSLGVSTWINQLESNDSWDVTMINSDHKKAVRTLYDSTTKDVYFTLGKETLGYNELTNSFVSFYDYYKASFMSNVLGNTISVGELNDNYYLWHQHAGNYNSFFGEYKPYWITYLVNPEPQLDKTFNIVEFRADTFNNSSLIDTDFNILEVWNEYQSNEVNITRELHRPSNLKQKFRIWRALIPRDKSNGRDRMRNPWLYVKLKSDNSNNNKTVLHDTQIHYF